MDDGETFEVSQDFGSRTLTTDTEPIKPAGATDPAELAM